MRFVIEIEIDNEAVAEELAYAGGPHFERLGRNLRLHAREAFLTPEFAREPTLVLDSNGNTFARIRWIEE